MTDPTPPHWRAPSGTCPHCATASLAAAWQAGVEKTCEEMQARIEALEAERDRLWEIIRDAHDAMKDGSDATAWAFLHAAVKAETGGRAALKGEGE